MLRVTSVSLFLLSFTGPCLAFQVKALSAGVIQPASKSNVETFDKIAQTPYGATTATGSFFENGVKFSGDAVVMKNGFDGAGSSLGLYAEPFHDRTNYMSILGDGQEIIQYGSYKTSFGLYWGSVDTFNYITFSNKAGDVAFFTGADLIGLGLTPDGDQTSDASNRYIEFLGLDRFDTVTLGSGGNSFEFDNVTASRVSDVTSLRTDGAPAPVAGTGLMSLVVVGGVVLIRRVRRSAFGQ